MKKTLLLLSVAGIVTLTALKPAQQGRGTAKVAKVQGIDVYVNSEPLAEYETQFTYETTMVTLVSCPGIQDQVNKSVETAAKKAKKAGVNIDAVIISGNKDLAITYK